MEVHFTPEQEAQLAQIATKAGTDPERLVKDVLVRYLDDEARFLAAVEKGIAAAERGEFIEEEGMDARIKRMLTPLEPARERGRVMAEALAALASRGTFAAITDPVAWQREVRHERTLPTRER